MTEIDVPDWVVEEAAKNAWPEFRSSMESVDWEFADDGRKDRLRKIARAALTPALGAWVVPACYRLHQPNNSSEWITGIYGGPPMNHKAWSVEQTFTLHQEKPDVLP